MLTQDIRIIIIEQVNVQTLAWMSAIVLQQQGCDVHASSQDHCFISDSHKQVWRQQTQRRTKQQHSHVYFVFTWCQVKRQKSKRKTLMKQMCFVTQGARVHLGGLTNFSQEKIELYTIIYTIVSCSEL